MELLTIGAFARASRLSPKALRLYDSLGLLTPAHVDEVSGYRFYRPDQLERARLVAWLRRLGMPLARIGAVCDLVRDAPERAAEQIAAYWAETEAELTARRALAAQPDQLPIRRGIHHARNADASHPVRRALGHRPPARPQSGHRLRGPTPARRGRRDGRRRRPGQRGGDRGARAAGNRCPRATC